MADGGGLRPTKEEAESFNWGGTRARPRKKIEAVFKKNEVYLKPPGSCTKWPGVSVNVSIECCESCQIFILDTTEQVQIADCKDCRIVVGPCVCYCFQPAGSQVANLGGNEADQARQIFLACVIQSLSL